MAGTGKKWFIGCGIGCGVFLLMAGGIGTCGYFGVKKIADRAKEMEGGYEALTDTYGQPGDFTPAADGTIGADRLELFLTIRDDLGAANGELASALATMDGEGEGGFIAKIKAGMTFAPLILDFIGARNQVLMDRGMGIGEYTHIYATAYYVWLGHDTGDGPNFALSGDDEGGDSGVRWGIHAGDGDESERRGEEVRRSLNKIQRKMVANQIAAAEGLALDESWLGTLRAEAVALEDRRLHLMWEEGLPEPTRTSLEPFRERLEASYVPIMNAIEMGLVEHN